MPQRIRSITAVIAAAALLLVADSCALAATRPPIPPSPAAREVTAAELATLDRAEEVLIGLCMGEHNFVYRPLLNQEAVKTREFPYVVNDLGWARLHGYGIAEQAKILQAKRTDSNQAYAAQLPPARRREYNTVFFGDRPTAVEVTLPGGFVMNFSDRGCLADARRTLYGDLRRWLRIQALGQNISQYVSASVTRDPAYSRARSSWATCVRRAGFPYADPQQMRAAVTTSAQETRFAVAEATCATSTGFDKVARDLDTSHRAVVRARHRTDLNELNRVRLYALPRAQEVIAGR